MAQSRRTQDGGHASAMGTVVMLEQLLVSTGPIRMSTFHDVDPFFTGD